jgi:hypothetical protein
MTSQRVHPQDVVDVVGADGDESHAERSQRVDILC